MCAQWHYEAMHANNLRSHTFLEVHIICEDKILTGDMYSLCKNQGIQFGLDI
jgi:hypothetical protein